MNASKTIPCTAPYQNLLRHLPHTQVERLLRLVPVCMRPARPPEDRATTIMPICLRCPMPAMATRTRTTNRTRFRCLPIPNMDTPTPRMPMARILPLVPSRRCTTSSSSSRCILSPRGRRRTMVMVVALATTGDTRDRRRDRASLLYQGIRVSSSIISAMARRLGMGSTARRKCRTDRARRIIISNNKGRGTLADRDSVPSIPRPPNSSA